MSESYTLLEARANLGDLVIRAQGGEPSVITRYGKPAAMIAPMGEQSRTVTLASGGMVTLGISVRMLHLSPEDREWVLDLIDMFKAHEAALQATQQQDAGSAP
jgi:prevent-host-death family protein